MADPTPAEVQSWQDKAGLLVKEDLGKLHAFEQGVAEKAAPIIAKEKAFIISHKTVLIAIVAILLTAIIGFYTSNYIKKAEADAVTVKVEPKIVPPVVIPTAPEPIVVTAPKVESQVAPPAKRKVYVPKTKATAPAVAKKQTEQLPAVKAPVPAVGPPAPEKVEKAVETDLSKIDAKFNDEAFSKFEAKMTEFEKRFK